MAKNPREQIQRRPIKSLAGFETFKIDERDISQETLLNDLYSTVANENVREVTDFSELSEDVYVLCLKISEIVVALKNDKESGRFATEKKPRDDFRRKVAEILDLYSSKKSLTEASYKIGFEDLLRRYINELVDIIDTTQTSEHWNKEVFEQYCHLLFAPTSLIQLRDMSLGDLSTFKTDDHLTQLFDFMYFSTINYDDETREAQLFKLIKNKNIDFFTNFPATAAHAWQTLQEAVRDLLEKPTKSVENDLQNKKKVRSQKEEQPVRKTLDYKKNLEAHVNRFYTVLFTPTDPLYPAFKTRITKLLNQKNEEERLQVFTVLGMTSISQLYEGYRQAQTLYESIKTSKNRAERVEDEEFYLFLLDKIKEKIAAVSDETALTIKEWELDENTTFESPNWEQLRTQLYYCKGKTSVGTFALTQADIVAVPWTEYGLSEPLVCRVNLDLKIIQFSLHFDESDQTNIKFTFNLNNGKEAIDWSFLDTPDLQANQRHVAAIATLATLVMHTIAHYSDAIKQNRDEVLKSNIYGTSADADTTKKSEKQHYRDPIYDLRKTDDRSQRISTLTPLPRTKEEAQTIEVHSFHTILIDNLEEKLKKVPLEAEDSVREAIAAFNKPDRSAKEARLRKINRNQFKAGYRLVANDYRVLLNIVEDKPGTLEIAKIGKRADVYKLKKR